MAHEMYLPTSDKTAIFAYLSAKLEQEEQEDEEGDKENGGISAANLNPGTPGKGSSADAKSPLKSAVAGRGGFSPPRSRSPTRDRRANMNVDKFSGGNVALSKSWYAVDPEANLPNTRKTMTSFLHSFKGRYSWPGVVAAIPTESEVRSRHDNSHLFIYCGHGAGEKVCDSHRLKKCHSPAAMLWGCSSGRLAVQGLHDPCGVALQYLVWGAPFVLGNLWDVTDKDIDKLSVKCMDTLFASATDGEKRVTVPAALAESRGVCKMAYAVGSAPVMYGLPAKIIV
jgi:hypothetical protein